MRFEGPSRLVFFRRVVGRLEATIGVILWLHGVLHVECQRSCAEESGLIAERQLNRGVIAGAPDSNPSQWRIRQRLFPLNGLILFDCLGYGRAIKGVFERKSFNDPRRRIPANEIIADRKVIVAQI